MNQYICTGIEEAQEKVSLTNQKLHQSNREKWDLLARNQDNSPQLTQKSHCGCRQWKYYPFKELKIKKVINILVEHSKKAREAEHRLSIIVKNSSHTLSLVLLKKFFYGMDIMNMDKNHSSTQLCNQLHVYIFSYFTGLSTFIQQVNVW